MQPVAGLEIFGTQGSDSRCVLADTCILRYASSWRDTDISRSLIRTRKYAHWDNKANPPHLPMMPSAAQQFRLEVAFSLVSSLMVTAHTASPSGAVCTAITLAVEPSLTARGIVCGTRPTPKDYTWACRVR